jgi:hypothetical protein
MSVRAAEPRDAAEYAKRLYAGRDINLLADEDVYKYPTLQTLVVEREGRNELMNSFHAVLVMECLAPREGITPLQEARALNELFEKIKQTAAEVGIKEIMFGCKDERLGKFIEGRDFERINFPVFRYKVKL